MAVAALFFVDLVDELASGIPVADAPGVRSELGLDYGEVSWFLLALPLLASMVLEPPLMLLSDRWARQRVVGAGLCAMGLSLLAAAVTRSAWGFSFAFAVWASAGGVGVGVAQTTLIAANPTRREHVMARWTLLGAIGDACTPLLLVGVAAVGGGFRTALAVAAGLHLVAAVGVLAGPLPTASAQDDDDDGTRSAWDRFRAGLRSRPLLGWLGATSLCALLDEVLVAFATLRMRDELGLGRTWQGALILAGAVGFGLGLVWLPRLLARHSPRRILIGASVVCTGMYSAWLLIPFPLASVALLFGVGLAAAPLYPLCQAQAYAVFPGRPGLVRAIDAIYTPVPILAPLVVGWLADHVSLRAALALLALQPVGIGVLTWRIRDAPGATREGGAAEG